MITITAQNYDVIGHVVLKPSPVTELVNVTRRVTKTATLDGGSTITDLGFSESDNDIDFILDEITSDSEFKLIRMAKLYPLLKLSSKDGVFLGAVTDLKTGVLPVTFRFLIKEKLSA